MLAKGLSLFILLTITLPAAPIDLIKLGKETFHALGDAECHSKIKNDTSVKTGPGLHELFPNSTRKRDIITSGDDHRHTELAISEVGPTKVSNFLPVMPPYPEALHQDPAEILVTDRTRIFRARINGSSARAVYVGLPGGPYYAFDPRTMTISNLPQKESKETSYTISK